MEEQWKDIPGFEGLYQVSSQGRIKRLGYESVKSCKTARRGGDMEQTWHVDERILSQTVYNESSHTRYVGLVDESGKRHRIAVKRLVAEAFIPGYDPSMTTNSIALKDPDLPISADNIYFVKQNRYNNI